MISIALRLLPYIAGAGAILVVAAWIYDAGYSACDQKAKAELLLQLQAARARAAEQRKKDIALAEDSAKREVQTRTVYRTITKEASHVTSPCTDVGTDFVRVLNRAVEAADTEAPASTK